MKNTAKKQAIIKSYGEYWDKLDDLSQKNALVEDGWLDFEVIRETGLVELFFNGRISTSIYHIALENDTIDRDFYRPKSLKGIENNNGWKSVHGDMPPENSGLYFVYDGKDVGIARMSILQFRTLNSNEVCSEVTHYQPIVKPEPPIY